MSPGSKQRSERPVGKSPTRCRNTSLLRVSRQLRETQGDMVSDQPQTKRCVVGREVQYIRCVGEASRRKAAEV